MISIALRVAEKKSRAMPDIEALRDLFDRVNRRLDDLKGRPPEARRVFLPGFALLKESVEQTSRYLLSLSQGRPRKPEHEEHLSSLWRLAGDTLKIHDPDLAGLCEHKGIYWANPEAWTVGEVQAARIDLANMKTSLKRMLSNDA